MTDAPKKKKKINSRAKGAKGELELVHKLKEYGFDAERTAQHCGNNGNAPDVRSSLEGIHIECKRTETLSLYTAMSQAISDAKEGTMPTVFHRRNNHEWLVVMRLSDWIELYKEGMKCER